MYRDVMPKVCKQGRDNIKVNVHVNLQKPHPCIIFTLVCNYNEKRCGNRNMFFKSCLCTFFDVNLTVVPSM